MSEHNFPNEEWRPIRMDGVRETIKYEVSNYGRIREYSIKKGEWVIRQPHNVLGYNYIGLKGDGKGSLRSVKRGIHRIVALHFLPEAKKGEDFVIHLDHDHKNNKVENLRFATQKELTEHNHSNPRVKEARKKQRENPRVTHNKLTETDVIRLKKRLKNSNNPLYKIAREFGITHTQLNRIRHGVNWKHVTIPEDEEN